ncbi:DUF4013 domain-containing protein [Haloferacaceae archaeon DSL9]
MISESLQYLERSEHAVKTTLIGGLLVLFSVLLLPAFLVSGYLLEVVRRTAADSDEPPVFEAWGDRLIAGFKASVIGFVYVGLPMFVVGLFGVLVVGTFSVAIPGDPGPIVGLFGAGVALFVVLLGMAVALGGAYASPAAIAYFADTGRMRDGFRLRTLWPVLTNRIYARNWLLAVGIIVASVLVTSLFAMVPVVGTVASAFVAFYALVMAWYVIGHTWADVRPLTTGRDGVAPTEQPAV